MMVEGKEALGAVPAFLQFGALGLLALVLVGVFYVGLRLANAIDRLDGSIERLGRAHETSFAEISRQLAALTSKVDVLVYRGPFVSSSSASSSGSFPAAPPPTQSPP